MTDTNHMIDVMNRFTGLINGLNIGEFRSDLHDDLVVQFPYAPETFTAGPTIKGADNFIAALSGIFQKYKSFNIVIDRMYPSPPNVIICEAHSNNVRIDDVVYENTYVLFAEFEGDKIIAWKEYYNPLKMANAGSNLVQA